MKLPRAPGAREQRWAHLLCGPVDAGPAQASPSDGASTGLEARVQALENEIAQLRSAVQNLCEQLGMSQPGQAE